MNTSPRQVGIDDMSLYVPKFYLPIETLAAARNIPFAKLHRGLGLTHMAIPDVHEDVATMAANAIADLIDKNNLHPRQIGRIYLGTESSLDGAKPMATYVVEMLHQKYEDKYTAKDWLHCDVVDLTFACIGGVDALHNTLDWVANKEGRIGIVACSDNAKYELNSTGEYTQGAGAVALLVKHQPRLLVIPDVWGVAMSSVHDFFKPIKEVKKTTIIEAVLQAANVNNVTAEEVANTLATTEASPTSVLAAPDESLTLFKETPIFDGQYSNQCYQNRTTEAFQHFMEEKGMDAETPLLENWTRLVFHLPYAFHAKRVFSAIYVLEQKRVGAWKKLVEKYQLEEPIAENFSTEKAYQKAAATFFKQVTKLETYKEFVQEKLENGQRASSLVGNMYAASIFLALMSTLETAYQEDSLAKNQKIGFFGYGSGSKSKVFEGIVQANWKEVVASFNIFDKLKQREALSYATYEALHTGKMTKSIEKTKESFALANIATDGILVGARTYVWQK